MTGRQGDMNFNRRSTGALPLNLEMHMQSILGNPSRQQQQRPISQGGTGYSGQSYGNSTFDQAYSRRLESKGSDFDNGVLSGGSQQQVRVPRERDRDDRRQFSVGGTSSVWTTKRSPSPQRGRAGDSDPWSRSSGFDDAGMRGRSQGIPSLMNTNIGPTSGQTQQPMVMVVPQGNAGAGGLMGMVQATPNPFSMQPQQPMQVIVGNLPGLNADAFGQQILAAASAHPQFGQGPNVMMGLMNQRQQPRSLFDQSIMEGGGGDRRFSRPSSNQRRSPGRSSTRRSDYSSSSRTTSRGSTHTSSATSSGNRKRVIRDRHGPTDDADRKRRRSSPARGSRDKSDRSSGKGKSDHDKQKKKDDAKTDDSKKDGDDKTKSDEAVKKDDVEGSETKGDEKKGEEKSADDGTEKEKQEKKSKYDDIPNAFLVCKICQKIMSDGTSFENHLNGRAHVALVKILEERFEERAHLLMFESRISEEELAIEMQRQRRAGKSSHSGKGSKNFCTMCDSTYTVNWGTHKVSLAHRVLKEYLHPTCRCCDINFVHRMDWVNHLQAVSHLRKLTELKEAGADVDEHESALQDELFAINVELAKDEHATPILLVRSTDYKTPTKQDLNDMLKDEKGEIALPEGEIEIPKEFVEDQVQGEEAMMSVEGACCKVCRIFIGNRADVEAHLKSKAHFGMYVSYLKKVVKYRENLIAEKEKAEREAAEKAEREKKKVEEEEAAAAAAAIKKQEEDEAKIKQEAEETSMETEEKVVPETPLDEADMKQEEDALLVTNTEDTEEETASTSSVGAFVKIEEVETITAETEEEEAGGEEEEAGGEEEEAGGEEEEAGGEEEDDTNVVVSEPLIEEVEETEEAVEPEVVIPKPVTPVKRSPGRKPPPPPCITKPQQARGAGNQTSVRGRGRGSTARGGRGGQQQQQPTRGGVALRGILKNSRARGRGGAH